MCKKLKIDKQVIKIEDTKIQHGPQTIHCWHCGRETCAIDNSFKTLSKLMTDFGEQSYLICEHCRSGIQSRQLKQFPKSYNDNQSIWTKYFKDVDSGWIKTGARFRLKRPMDNEIKQLLKMSCHPSFRNTGKAGEFIGANSATNKAKGVQQRTAEQERELWLIVANYFDNEFYDEDETKIEAAMITGKGKPVKLATAKQRTKKPSAPKIDKRDEEISGLKSAKDEMERSRDEWQAKYFEKERERNTLFEDVLYAAKRLDECERNQHQNESLVAILREKLSTAQNENDELHEEIADCECQVREALQARSLEMAGA